MDIIFFDLDGTLLNKSSEITPYTRDTLAMLRERGIVHTVATGRTMLSAQRVLGDYSFELPSIFSNGVTIWDPRNNALQLDNLLSRAESQRIIESAMKHGLAPFIHTITTTPNHHEHTVFHGELTSGIEKSLVDHHFSHADMGLKPLTTLGDLHNVTNISMIGNTTTVKRVYDELMQFDGLIAYSGPALEGDAYSWIDVHHRLANKGSAVDSLKATLGASNVICFGDSYNDASMFELADESYAPLNAKDEIKAMANEVIGHHDKDGVARFLRERFDL